MTGSLILDLAISLAGVALLVALSWALGGMKTIPVTLEAARERLAFDEPDFLPGEWFVGRDAKAAAVTSLNGEETALVFALGDGLATRRFRHGAIGVERAGKTVLFRLGEPSRAAVRLDGGDEESAARWVLTLAGRRL